MTLEWISLLGLAVLIGIYAVCWTESESANTQEGDAEEAV